MRRKGAYVSTRHLINTEKQQPCTLERHARRRKGLNAYIVKVGDGLQSQQWCVDNAA